MSMELDSIAERLTALHKRFDKVSMNLNLQVPNDLLCMVATIFQVTPMQIRGSRKLFRLVVARWTLFRLLTNRGWSSTEVGRAMHKDHATVLRGLRELADLIQDRHSELARLARKALDLKA